MWGTCCKCSSETTWWFPRHELLKGLLIFFMSLNLKKKVDLILTILLKYSFSWTPFSRSLICKNLNVFKFGLEFKFPQVDKFLKIKLDTGSISKYEKLKLWKFCEIYLTVHNGNHETDFLMLKLTLLKKIWT